VGEIRVLSESYGELRFLLQRYKISLKYTREPPVFLKFFPDFSKSPYNGKWKAESGKTAQFPHFLFPLFLIKVF
jgi:hypothetical protein